MTKKNDTEEKHIVPGVTNELLNGFLSLLTLKFIREDREGKQAEKEKAQNG